MKKLLTLLLLCIPSVIFAQSKKKVLFIGNSFTYVNSMPSIVADIAANMGDTLIFDANTVGGASLQSHWNDPVTLSKIQQGGWDYVVLQAQSQEPSYPTSYCEAALFPYARKLDSLIDLYNPCAHTIFYMTWGWKNGDIAVGPPTDTYEGMDSMLHLHYMMMADLNHAEVSPAGAVFHYIRHNFPSIELYNPDDYHPSQAGSYAAACSFYTALFRNDPTLITYDYALSTTDAANIRAAAKSVVFDSLLHWHLGEYDLTSDFSYTLTSGTTYQFTNLSQNAEGQLWNFGGATDTSANPSYSFAGAMPYTVQLTTFDQCDTATTTHIIGGTGITAVSPLDNLRIFPNPANSNLYINAVDAVSVFIYDLAGRSILSVEKMQVNAIDVSRLSEGLYLLKISLGAHAVTRQLEVRR